MKIEIDVSQKVINRENMNLKKELFESLEYDESLAYTGWAEMLPIKKRELKLFDRSIIGLGKKAKEKWRKIVEEKASNGGSSDCSYCMRFREALEEDGCPGCPIEYFTKGGRCLATPYYTYVKNPTTSNARAMKDFIDKIFIRSLLLLDLKGDRK